MHKIEMVKFLQKNGVVILKDKNYVVLINQTLPEDRFAPYAQTVEWDTDTGKMASRVWGGKKSQYGDNFNSEEAFLKAYISANFQNKKLSLMERVSAALRVLRAG
jgi:hypothetical protein